MLFRWKEICFDEDSTENIYALTYRAKVFGGWIVRNIILLNKTTDDLVDRDWEQANISMVFVSDPKHEWEISEDI